MDPRAGNAGVHFVEVDGTHSPAQMQLRYASGFALLTVRDGERERAIAAKYSRAPLIGTWHYSEAAR